MSNNTEHDKGLEWIVHRLDNGIISHDPHNVVEPHIEVEKKFGFNGYGIMGEVDVFAQYNLGNGSHILLFEYKSCKNNKLRSKAYEQLFLAKKFFEQKNIADEIITFYVHGQYHLDWVLINEISYDNDGFKFSIKEHSASELKLKKYKPLGYDEGFYDTFLV